MKKYTLLVSLFVILMMCFNTAYAENSSSVICFNDILMEFKNPPKQQDGCTIVPMRELSETAGFTVLWDGEQKKITAYNEKTCITMYIGDTNIQVLTADGEDRDVTSILPPQIINSVTYIPLRTVSEAFGARVQWDPETKDIFIYMQEFSNVSTEETEETAEDVVAEEAKEHTFYSQYDPEYTENLSDAPYNWTKTRNGYCYVTAYAMLLSDLTGDTVTPKDIADINLAENENPSICYHYQIVLSYEKTLVPAISEDSPYFKEYNSGRGLTYIDNSSADAVIAAIKEALNNHPKGVMVRDMNMPHTMVAIGYIDDTIYFNDPALLEGNVAWEETTLKKSDITAISAIIAIE